MNPKRFITLCCVLTLLLVESAVSFAVTDAPVLTVTPGEIDFGVMRDTDTTVRSIALYSKGKVTWRIRWVEPWLSLDSYSGLVEDGMQFITITASPRTLPLGQYQTEIVIATSSGTRTVPISVTVLRGSDAIPEPELEQIFLVPQSVAAQVGRKIQLGVVGMYSDGSEKDITGEVEWVSDNDAVGYFLEKDGLLVGKSTGTVGIFAKKDRVTSPVITIPVGALSGPFLKASIPRVVLDHIEKGSMETLSLSLRNAGEGDLEWEVISLTPWLIIEGESPGSGLGAVPDLEDYLSENGTPDVDEAGYGRLRGMGPKELNIIIDTTGVPDGEHEGVLSVRSNGGDERIIVPITVLSLTSISLIPVSVTMAVHDRILLRATGIWSDGCRTDLSSGSDGRWTISDESMGYFLRRSPVFIASKAGQVTIKRERGTVSSNVAIVAIEEAPVAPVLFVSPHEVDFGTIGPGEISKGDIVLRNVGGAGLTWQVYGVGDWFCTGGEDLSGSPGRAERRLHIRIESVEEDAVFGGGLFPVRISLGTGRHTVSYEKYLATGSYREELRLLFNGGERSVFLNFVVAETISRSRMVIEPLGIDFGYVSAEGTLAQKIELKNEAEKVLRWGVTVQGGRKSFRGVALPEKGRYISFANEALAGKARYRVPKRLTGKAEFSGEWTENDGYPSSILDDATVRYAFWGSGITLQAWKGPYGGIAEVFVDGRPAGEVDLASGSRERVEFTAAKNLFENDSHLLVIRVTGGVMELEGVRVYSSDLITNQKGWITISPERGTTTNEVDFITVTVTPEGLSRGSYTENIVFYSDEGIETVNVSLDVVEDKHAELIQIYRYIRGTDIRLAAEGPGEELLLRGYRKDAPLFKLFRKGTSGTSEFFQWYNPSKSASFYSYDRSGGKRSLEGYLFNGSIGNIATLKLPHTRDLYRWFNPRTAAYGYTVDPKGEDYQDQGYRYDGVAGYVR